MFGKYGAYIYSAWAIAVGVFVLIIIWNLWQMSKSSKQLEILESLQENKN